MNRPLAASALMVGLLALFATPAPAAQDIIKNGGFERGFPATADNNAWQTVGYREDISLIPSWTETGDGVDWYRNVPEPGSPAAREGSHLIDLVGAGGAGRIQQVIPTTIGAHYTLSFFYAANPACVGTGSVTAGSATLEVGATGSNSYMPATLGFTAAAAFTTVSFQSLAGGLACPGGVTIDDVSARCTTPPPAGSMLCETGSSTIRGGTGCVGAPFRVVVSGREIERVVFALDDDETVLTRPNVGSLYVLAVNPRTLKVGVHRVFARVIYTRRSGTPDKRLRVTFSRCLRRATAPSFSGETRKCDQARVDIAKLRKRLVGARGKRRKTLIAALTTAKNNEQRYCS